MMSDGWNFETFEKYVNQRFEAQQTGTTAAFVAAEKAVSAALVAAEKAVDKAEVAQQLRNESQNEFRKSLSDLSSLMWTIKEGTAAVDSLRREIAISLEAIRKSISVLENANSNIQGRIWAVNALFMIITVAISVGVRFIGH